MKTIYVFLAEGFEEVEALTPVDVLRRAGLPVKTVSVTGVLTVNGAHGVPVRLCTLYGGRQGTDEGFCNGRDHTAGYIQ